VWRDVSSNDGRGHGPHAGRNHGPQTAATVEVEDQAGTAAIAAVDQGMGMPEEQAPHLFQPFNRPGQQGSGAARTELVLVISRRLVATMNGQIQLKGQPGQGSRFELRLPPAELPSHSAARPGLATQVQDPS
jgi:signal transduction histidine kinase